MSEARARACHCDGTKQHELRLAHGWLQVVPSPTKKLRMSIAELFFSMIHPPLGLGAGLRRLSGPIGSFLRSPNLFIRNAAELTLFHWTTVEGTFGFRDVRRTTTGNGI